ncbi:MAG: hypothetical protein H6674_02095 [Dehalococcoidia bacterium]|nr:hypothetical protein [Dehalococcoidia bacterium]
MSDYFDQQGNPAKPEGLHPLGQPDARYPVFYAESVPNGLRVMSEFFAALAARDLEAIADCFHYPFALYEGTEPVVVESRDAFLASPPRTLNVTGDGPTRIQPGSYDLLDSIEIHVYNPVGAGLSLALSRHGANGEKIHVYEGIFAVTNNDGRWGIQLASSIITPREALGVTYPDAEQAAMRRGHDWMLGYTLRDQSVLNSTRLPGRTASAGLGNPRLNAGSARTGNPMAGYVIAGVGSRLTVSELTQEDIDASDANFPQFAEWAGGGVGQWDFTINLPEARVVHATVDKVHVFTGYVRYTEDGRKTSETHSLSISAYRNGRWGSAGGFGVMMYHDFTNDLPRAE